MVILQFKIDSHFADFGQVKIDSICSSEQILDHNYFTEIWQDVRLRKTIQIFSVSQKIQEPPIRFGTSHFLMIQSVGIKNWVPS